MKRNVGRAYPCAQPTSCLRRFCLSRRIQHIFDQNSIAPGGVVDEDMGHGTNQLSVLDDGGAGHG